MEFYTDSDYPPIESESNIVKIISTLDRNLNNSEEHSETSFDLHTQEEIVNNKFEKIQQKLEIFKANPEAYLNSAYEDYKIFSPRKNLQHFYKEIEKIKQNLSCIHSQIQGKFIQTIENDAKLEKIEKKIKKHDEHIEKIETRSQNLEILMNEYDRVSSYFQNMFEGFRKNDMDELEVNARHTKLENMLKVISTKKKTSASPRPSTQSTGKLILSPRRSKVLNPKTSK